MLGTKFLVIFSFVHSITPTHSLSTHSTSKAKMAKSINWVSTALRIKNPKVSIPFYEKNFGMKVAKTSDSGDKTHYFMVRPKDAEASKFSYDPLNPPTEKKLFSHLCNYLELIHKHGSETDENLKYDSGNVEPKRGFGHIAFSVNDVYASCERLEAAGAAFKKKPDEGRMKGLAFVLDPDGYWIEILKRTEGSGFSEEYNLSQTMMRIKDPARSIAFYTGLLGMSLLTTRHFSDFSLYFLASLSPDSDPLPTDDNKKYEFVKRLWNPVLELTFNHGTEKDENFAYHSGNEDPLGFCNIGFASNNLSETCSKLKKHGVRFAEKDLVEYIGAATDGKIEVAIDPDGYAVKIVEK